MVSSRDRLGADAGRAEVIKRESEQCAHALKDGDLAIGDSFWIGDVEFEVVDKRSRSAKMDRFGGLCGIVRAAARI